MQRQVLMLVLAYSPGCDNPIPVHALTHHYALQQLMQGQVAALGTAHPAHQVFELG